MMGFSAIIPAAEAEAANVALEAQGFGPWNFSVPLWRGTAPDPDSYGLNVGGDHDDFRAAIAALPSVSIQDAARGMVGFDEHVAAEGLSREPYAQPEQHDGST
jgi:hypothetical protein